MKKLSISSVSFILNVLLSIVVIYLIIENYRLRTPLSESLKVGEEVIPLKLKTLNNENLDIYYNNDENYLLFFLSTTCPHCEKNLEKWNKIAAKEKQNNLRILGISIDNKEQTELYFITKSINFFLCYANNEELMKNYKLFGVPQTILISNAKVRGNWIGELSEDNVKEILFVINQLN